MNFWFRLTLAVLLFTGPALLAETIYMRDGRVLAGRIVNQSRTDITLQTAQGVLTISKEQIRRIQYDNPQQDAAKAEEARRLEEQRREQERKLQEERLKEYERQQQLQRQQNDQRLLEEKKRREEEEAKKRLELEKKEPAKTPDDFKRREEERLRRLKEFEENAKKLGPTWYGALVRNLILPGWGEVYQGRRTKGFVMAGSFAALTTFALYEGERYRKNYTNYADTTRGFLFGTPFVQRNVFSVSLTDAQAVGWLILGSDQTQRSRERMQMHAARYGAAKTAVAAFYIFGIVDVLLFKPQSNTQVGLGSNGEDLHLAFTANF